MGKSDTIDLPRPAAGTAAGRGVSHGVPTPVLYLDHTAKLSGGEIALLRLLESLDPTRVRPVVLLAEGGAD